MLFFFLVSLFSTIKRDVDGDQFSSNSQKLKTEMKERNFLAADVLDNLQPRPVRQENDASVSVAEQTDETPKCA